ncbi:rho GTPase-activating protein gacA [Thecamonas trahens ATCC 50062]|uniref:Rho GTPase-activating protein gacA n=1 Tax=Thecamonas trahens ATCC 50062 TaxID=461836 RepID=A0A0L0D1Y9_THETB|nr:rho GTPase-activating protein gacA [Thecamonas trahens ATCC 50062]KNC46135.1 rho GTPase-activating protein gacA [Thecamonas trahens ATCC 50062]|eukprot:XP_013763112.1 rho GTPase-activating protein gacA [Thecamonas trahens ATCC 50062]
MSAKRSKDEASGFGAVPGGPQAEVVWRAEVPVVEPTRPTGKMKDKELNAVLAGHGKVLGGPISDMVTWDLGAVATGLLEGGPELPNMPQAVAEAANVLLAGAMPGGPPQRISEYTGSNRWKLAARKVLEAVEAGGKREGLCVGGPPQPELVFGVALDDLLQREGGRIPYVIALALDYLARDDYASCKLTGIFRLSGATSDVELLVETFNWGRADVNLDAITNDPIAVAALIKLFLRQLPEPLITYECNPVFLGLAANPTVDTVADAIRALPQTNAELLLQICTFLNIVSTFADVNKMASHNLAIVVGPNILRLPNVSPLEEIAMSSKVSTISQFMIEYAYDLAHATDCPNADRIYYDQLYPPEVSAEATSKLASTLAGLDSSSDGDDDDVGASAAADVAEAAPAVEAGVDAETEASEAPVADVLELTEESAKPTRQAKVSDGGFGSGIGLVAAAAGAAAAVADDSGAGSSDAIAASDSEYGAADITPTGLATPREVIEALRADGVPVYTGAESESEIPSPPADDPPTEAMRIVVEKMAESE